MLVLVDKHGLYHSQVVVERDDGVQQGDENQHVISLLCRGGKYEELAEEPGKWRDSCQREQGDHHHEAQAGIRGVQPVVIINRDLAGAMLHDSDNPESGQVRQHVHQHVVH